MNPFFNSSQNDSFPDVFRAPVFTEDNHQQKINLPIGTYFLLNSDGQKLLDTSTKPLLTDQL